MTRKERCELFYEKGYRYNPETGEITGIRGKVVTAKRYGYIYLAVTLDEKHIKLYGHQFAWWSYYQKIHENDILSIDHDDRVKTNNRISNLKLKPYRDNNLNRDWIENCKGYTFYKRNGKWRAQIRIERERKHLGYFDTEQEAREVYLTALKNYYPDRYETLKNINKL